MKVSSRFFFFVLFFLGFYTFISFLGGCTLSPMSVAFFLRVFFKRLRVLRRHLGILDFLSLLLLRCICSVFPIFLCFSMHLRPRGSVRIRRPEMMDEPFV